MVDLERDRPRDARRCAPTNSASPTSRSSPALAAGLPPVFADGHQVKQVLLNLLMNAEQAMLAAHGRGTHRDPHVARQRQADGRARGERRRPGRRRGRAGEDLRSVLHHQGSRQGHRARASPWPTPSSRSTAGASSLKSQRGTGASFFVELPVSGSKPAAQPRQPATPARADAADVFKGARVLVVEDEPALATAVKEAFTDAGFVVDRAGDGEEGLARVAQKPLRPDRLRPEDAAGRRDPRSTAP